MNINNISPISRKNDFVPPQIHENKIAQKKVNEAAKSALHHNNCFLKIHTMFKKAVLWIVSIPSIVSEIFKSRNKQISPKQHMNIQNPQPATEPPVNTNLPENENNLPTIKNPLEQQVIPKDEQANTPKEPAASNNPEEKKVKENKTKPINDQQIETAAQKPEPNGTALDINHFQREAEALAQKTQNLNFDSLDVIDEISDIQSQIESNLLLIDELKHTKTTRKSRRTIQNIHNQFQNLKNNLERKFQSQSTVFDDFAFENQSLTDENTPQAPEDDRPLSKQEEVARNQRVPPTFSNQGNNCWFHSTMEFLWSWKPYFSNLIKEKNANMLQNLKAQDMQEANTELRDSENLLKALSDFNDAMVTGDNKKLQAATVRIQNSVIKMFPELQQAGRQQDAEAFLNFILGFLMERVQEDGTTAVQPFLKIKTTRRGLDPGQEHLFKEKTETALLQVFHMKNKSSFQEILDANFVEEENYTDPTIMNGVDVDHYSEKLKIDNETPPEFIFIHMARFIFPSREELKEQEAKINEQRKTLVQQILDGKQNVSGSRRKRRSKKTSVETAEAVSQEALSEESKKEQAENKRKEDIKAAITQLKAQHKWPEVDRRGRKINTSIKFPEDHKVNFAAAFGAEDPSDPNYIYELRGAIVHEGESLEVAHYTSNVVSIDPSTGKDQWYHCDDRGSIVKEVTNQIASEKNGNGYIYYFQKVKS